MKIRRLKRWRGMIPVFVVLMMVSCADHCARGAYNKVVNERTEAFVHTKPHTEIWPVVTQELDKQSVGFDGPAPQVGRKSVSPWYGEAGDRFRVHVSFVAQHPSGVALEVMREREYKVNIYPDMGTSTITPKPIGERLETESKRDLTVEWAVLKTLEPKAAQEIEVEAAERAEVVRDVVASGCK